MRSMDFQQYAFWTVIARLFWVREHRVDVESPELGRLISTQESYDMVDRLRLALEHVADPLFRTIRRH